MTLYVGDHSCPRVLDHSCLCVAVTRAVLCSRGGRRVDRLDRLDRLGRVRTNMVVGARAEAFAALAADSDPRDSNRPSARQARTSVS